ncbi:class I SAM-dependent methyltransferase [Streptosporangium longisporum]|uniref:Class I SAM-dependent methyltransferase n=1 Tax=Streptosporangium longisporum TaxID=46187 RepID=A0ABP6LE45_9ACTN
MSDTSPRDARLRRYWDRQAGSYDRRMALAERRFFADTRPWLCGQATGETLEVAVGTGLNLAHYPGDVRLTGVEWSVPMLAVARRRADDLGREADLRHGDARSLSFGDESFDTVVCTFALCGIPDERVALAEMARVLRPGGTLLLADHVASSSWPVRVLQGLLDAVSVPTAGEHYRRRPIREVRAMGFTVERHERFKAGVIERFSARKPGFADR